MTEFKYLNMQVDESLSIVHSHMETLPSTGRPNKRLRFHLGLLRAKEMGILGTQYAGELKKGVFLSSTT